MHNPCRARAFTPALVLSLCLIPAAQSVTLPEGFVDEAVISEIPGQITGFEFVSGGQGTEGGERVFLSEKAGIVRVAVDGQLQPEPFLDISDIVNDRVDRGLMDIAVHPQFPDAPFVYVLYAFDPPELVSNGFTGPGRQDGSGNRVARLVRFTADAESDFNVAMPGSEVVLMGTNSTFANIGEPEGQYDTSNPSCGPIGNPLQDCLPVDELSHTVGAVAFAPDGTLYVTNGDGASYQSIEPLSFMSLDIDSMRGKIFRIDPVTGGGLPDNPHFDGNPQSNRSKVIAHGLRNPYSLAIHPETGEPFVGDVGFESFEEINGGFNLNFGWPCFLGSNADGQNLRSAGFEELELCQDYYDSAQGNTPPMISWPWVNGAAAMVGDFYFGQAFPEQYHGMLFYADFVQGFLRYVEVDIRSDVQGMDFATDLPPVTQITSRSDGALYYASIATNELRRIRYTGEGTNTTETSGTDDSGTAGTATAGSGTAGSGTADTATAGSGTSGSTTAGSGTAGAATAGSDTTGSGAEGGDSAGTGGGAATGEDAGNSSDEGAGVSGTSGTHDSRPVRTGGGGSIGWNELIGLAMFLLLLFGAGPRFFRS